MPAPRARVIATLTAPPTASELADLDGRADCLEVRADLAGDLDPRFLRSRFAGELIYALHSVPEDGGDPARHERLAAAARDYDIVDLEHDRDLVPALLDRLSPHRRRLSWSGRSRGVAELKARLRRMVETPAALYQLAPAAQSIEEGLDPLRLLRDVGRADVTAFAAGPTGAWTRLLAPRFGASVVSGAVGDAAVPGMPALSQLGDYGLPALDPVSCVYGIVGGSDRRSLAPWILNTAFSALGRRALYLPFFPRELAAFWRDIVLRGLPELGMPVLGLTVVRPHKERALELSDLRTERAERAGAANSLSLTDSGWRADNTTDVIEPLGLAGVEVAGRRAAVIGCGGAGRSVAAELRDHGADVTLVNRGAPRGEYASRLLGLPWTPLSEFGPRGFDLFVNATPLTASAPVEAARFASGAAVVDLAYVAGAETALVAAARRSGLTVVDGRQVLAAETGSQFRLLTGEPMPPQALAVALGDDGAEPSQRIDPDQEER